MEPLPPGGNTSTILDLLARTTKDGNTSMIHTGPHENSTTPPKGGTPQRSGVGRSGRARSAGRDSIRALILFWGRDTRQEDVEGSPAQSRISPSIQRILRLCEVR